MKNLHRFIIIALSFSMALAACDGQEDDLVEDRLTDFPAATGPTGSAGTLDFSNYVAIGASLTAGFADAALYDLAQENSFPAMLHNSMTFAGAPATFTQPDIDSPSGFNTSVQGPAGSGIVLGRFELDTSIPGPSPRTDGDPIGNWAGNASDLNNFGIPGAVTAQLLTPLTGTAAEGNTAFNPYYQRYASNPGTSTPIQDIISAQPTFFTMTIGANDVLGYAVSGGANDAILNDPATFQVQYQAVVDALMDNTSADGIVAGVPLLLGIPFFRAVPYNAIALDEATATALNAGFGGFNQLLQAAAGATFITADDAAARTVTYSAGANPILVIDEELTDLGPFFDNLLNLQQIDQATRAALVPLEQARPLVAGELVVLSAGSVLGTLFDSENPSSVIGAAVPLGFNTDGSLSGDRWYLTAAEQGLINQRSIEFSTIIGTIAATNPRLGYYNPNTGFAPGDTEFGFLADVQGLDGSLGVVIDGVTLAPDFSPNGIFSTDGIHPNARGYAFLANEIMDAIETNWPGTVLPRQSVLNLHGVILKAD